MIHIVFHGVQCTTLYCTLAYLMMGSSDLSTIIITNHQPQPQSEHQHLNHYYHQGLSFVHTCCRHMTDFLCQLMTTSPIQIIIGIAISSLCLIRIIYSYTLLSEVSSSSSSSYISSTSGEKLSYADNRYEQMGLSSWIYMMSMFVLFNVAVMRCSARTSMTRSRSFLGDGWMDEYHI